MKCIMDEEKRAYNQGQKRDQEQTRAKNWVHQKEARNKGWELGLAGLGREAS